MGFSIWIFDSSAESAGSLQSSLFTRHDLLDHFIRPRQHIRRNRQADLVGGFQINDQLKLYRLLNRKISGLGVI